MDEKTKLLVCLGAATAANCIPCFEFSSGKAVAAEKLVARPPLCRSV